MSDCRPGKGTARGLPPPGGHPYLVIVLLCVLVELVQGHEGVEGVCVCLQACGRGCACDPGQRSRQIRRVPDMSEGWGTATDGHTPPSTQTHCSQTLSPGHSIHMRGPVHLPPPSASPAPPPVVSAALSRGLCRKGGGAPSGEGQLVQPRSSSYPGDLCQVCVHILVADLHCLSDPLVITAGVQGYGQGRGGALGEGWGSGSRRLDLKLPSRAPSQSPAGRTQEPPGGVESGRPGSGWARGALTPPPSSCTWRSPWHRAACCWESPAGTEPVTHPQDREKKMCGRQRPKWGASLATDRRGLPIPWVPHEARVGGVPRLCPGPRLPTCLPPEPTPQRDLLAPSQPWLPPATPPHPRTPAHAVPPRLLVNPSGAPPRRAAGRAHSRGSACAPCACRRP